MVAPAASAQFIKDGGLGVSPDRGVVLRPPTRGKAATYNPSMQ